MEVKSSMLESENIYFSVGDKKILENVSIDIEKGKIISIIGPNGSGKTTLLRALSRNISPEKGVIYLDGKNIKKLKNKYVAKEMAILSQSYSTPKDVTVRELVYYGRYAHENWWRGRSNEDKEIVDWAIDRTGLGSFANKKVINLSGGERQRAWIAMAIAQKPKVLLLDEPTTYLDISFQYEVLELVRGLNKEDGITVAMVLHDINQAANYSDVLVAIKDGSIYKTGNAHEIVNKEILQDVFNIVAEVIIDHETKKPYFFIRNTVSKELKNKASVELEGIG